MSEPLPEIIAGLSREDGSGIAVVESDVFADLPALLAAYPALRAPENALALARILTHFARKSAYQVIEDPAAFETDYLARMETEDPTAPWRQGVYRLRDYGKPDFAAIYAPRNTDAGLVFFARDDMIGMPYRVTAGPDDASLQAPVYTPMPLMPVDPPRAPDGDAVERSDAGARAAATTRD